ncbi:hypothetical protein BDZ91DRAFT_467860 [Kalaharituber pfeilii]|nr:hypothetical protein BDZ91DRAFT_467860 [Kalaharituber pfeilii]
MAHVHPNFEFQRSPLQIRTPPRKPKWTAPKSSDDRGMDADGWRWQRRGEDSLCNEGRVEPPRSRNSRRRWRRRGIPSRARAGCWECSGMIGALYLFRIHPSPHSLHDKFTHTPGNQKGYLPPSPFSTLHFPTVPQTSKYTASHAAGRMEKVKEWWHGNGEDREKG